MTGKRQSKISVFVIGIAVLLGLSFFAFSSPPKTQKTIDDLHDKSVLVPEFSIAVKLSPKAQKQLESIHESIKVIAYFDGDALPGLGRYNAPFRDVFLGEDEKLVDASDIAAFGDTKISLRNWNRLSNKDYFVTINVVSARKHSKNNLLDCGVPEDRISTFQGKTTDVSCWLIGEPNAPTK
jgi:hypothetical protein